MKKILHSMRWFTFVIMCIMATTMAFAQTYPDQLQIAGKFDGQSNWKEGVIVSGNNGIYWFTDITFSANNGNNFKFHTTTGTHTEYYANSNNITVVSGQNYDVLKKTGENYATWKIAKGTYTFKLDLTQNKLYVNPTEPQPPTPSQIHAFVDHVALTSSSFSQANYDNKSGVTNSSLKEAELRYEMYKNSDGSEVTSGYTLTVTPPSGGSQIAEYNSTTKKITLKSGATSGEEVWTATFSKTGEENLVVDFDVTCSAYTYVNSPADTQKDIKGSETYDGWQSYDGKKYVYNSNTSDALVEFYAGDNPYVKQYKKKNGQDWYDRLIWDKGTSAVSPWGVGAHSEASYSTPTTGTYVGEKRGWINRRNHPDPKLNAMTEKHRDAVSDDNQQQITSNDGIWVNGTSKKYFYYQYQYTAGDEFGMPVMGSFYRFYPKKDGKMSIYFYMNGVTDGDQEQVSGTYNKCRDRRSYFLNAKSQSLPALTAEEISAGKEGVTEAKAQGVSSINPAFFKITPTSIAGYLPGTTGIIDPDWWKECVKQVLLNWEAWGNPSSKKPTQAATWDEMSDAEKTAWANLSKDKEGIHQQPFQNADGSYSVISPAYLKITLNVKAGETYYLTPTMTKTRLCAVDFFPTQTGEPTEVEFYNGSLPAGVTPTNMTEYVLPSGANEWMETAQDGDHFNVKLADRTFAPNTWYSFCFPFNVSVEQIKEWFGKDAYTLHFDKVSHGTNTNGEEIIQLNMKKHFYPQICAGAPIFLRTGANITAGTNNVKFSNLYYRKNVTVDPSYSTDDRGTNWIFDGSYTPCSMGTNTYFMAGATETVSNCLYHVKGEKKTPGNRAWFRPLTAPTNAPRIASVSILGIVEDGNADEEPTAIKELLEKMGFNVRNSDDCIYNINGQVVGHGDALESLPKGLYIVNGKKIMK